MEDNIKKFMSCNNEEYIKITNDESLKLIYNLLFNNIFFIPKNYIEALYISAYYMFIEFDKELIKKFLLKSIELGYSHGDYIMGCYYQNIELDYDEMEKYYLSAVSKGDSSAMVNLAYYYAVVEKDLAKVKNYYELAVDKNDPTAMFGLGNYYKLEEENIEMMKKYYLMGCYQNSSQCFEGILSYYADNINDASLNIYDQYFFKFIDLFDSFNLNEYDVPELFMVIKKQLGKKLKLIKKHFKYSPFPQNYGFNKAKDAFYQHLNQQN